MTELLERLHESGDFLRRWSPGVPPVGIVLGSGYARVAEALENDRSIPYQDVPHFPVCTNPAHPGRLRVGTLSGHPVVVLQGRLHCYEGYDAEAVVYPVRALALWGVESFVLTNAAGAIHPNHRVGDFMAIRDHINFMGRNPLVGKSQEGLGPRFPDVSQLYDRHLIAAARDAAAAGGIRLHEGVYAAMLGPSYETPAEIRMLRTVGADAVGMSTVPEAIALGHLGRRVFGLSLLSNLAAGISHETLSDDEIVQVFERPQVQAALQVILRGVLDALRERRDGGNGSARGGSHAS